MKLLAYIEDMDRRRALAAACDTSPEYLWQIASGWKGRKPSHGLARRIEAATHGEVSRHDLRPDVFGLAPTASANEEREAA
jgi:DNA-binding transcriptional regulator YdaS (Cro superfamily)